MRAKRDGRRSDKGVVGELFVEESRASSAPKSPELAVDVRAVGMDSIDDLYMRRAAKQLSKAPCQ